MPADPDWRISFIPYYMTSPGRWSAPKPEDAIRVLRKAGYDGVEWMLGHHFNTSEELARLVVRTRKGRLQVSNIMCWRDLVTNDRKSRDRSKEILKEMVACAGELSIPVMNVFTGPMTWNPKFARIGKEISEGQAWKAVVDSLSEVLAVAEKSGVVVTVEPVFGMLVHDYYTVRELLGYFDSKHLGVNVDPSHFALYGNDPAWAVKRLGKRVKHVHVKDAFGRPGVFGETFSFPFLGEGVIDWRAFFSALRDVGYQGFLSLEFENDSYLNNVCDGEWSVAAVQLRDRVNKFLPG
jgi:sugar phosphate isomerase/epimerase